MNSAILENQMIERLARTFRRSPRQVNGLNESDAEIIRLGDSTMRLAITTDSIVEEIASRLYDDPHMIGWMAATANLSDLAAVGAAPLGLLMAETLPPDLSHEFIRDLQQGIEDACCACGTYVLGGDTNTGTTLELTGSAVGTVEGAGVLSRVGCRPGHLLYSSGLLGNGNAFAISRFLPSAARYPYAPCARIREGQMIRGIASACMDTSDGTLSTLDQLMRLNNVGFRLHNRWNSALAPAAMEIAVGSAIPTWLLAGQHGEFELLFTVAPEMEQELLGRASSVGWQPVQLGIVIPQPSISFEIYGAMTRIDSARIRNAAFAAQGSAGGYISELIEIDRELQKGDPHHGKQ